MKNTTKTPQITPVLKTGIFIGTTVAEVREPYAYSNGMCIECECTDGGHARWCGAVN